jgi:hypothetical protein
LKWAGPPIATMLTTPQSAVIAVALRAAVVSVAVTLCTVPHGMIGRGTMSSSRTSLVALGPLLRSLAMIVSFDPTPGVRFD